MPISEIREFHAFSTMVSVDASRDLALLNRIENTLNSLDVDLLRARQSNKIAKTLIEKALAATGVIDQTGMLVKEFEKNRDSIADKHRDLVIARQSASDDSRLNEHDGIIEGYDSLISALAELHNNLNTLAWTVGENDADYDETLPEKFSDANSLFDALGV